MRLKEKLDLTIVIAGCVALVDFMLASLFQAASRAIHDPTTAVLLVFVCGGLGGVITALAAWALIRLWIQGGASR